MSSKQRDGAPRVLHLHSTFAAGGKELRSVQLINAFGSRLAHSIVSADRNAYGAAEHIAKGRTVRYPRKFPPLKGKPWPTRLRELAIAMKPYDLVLTYNWGAIESLLGAGHAGMRAVVHHEEGFGPEEFEGLLWRRNWARRWLLRRAHAVVDAAFAARGRRRLLYPARNHGRHRLIQLSRQAKRLPM